ncbi:MAG: response regulator [Candidatus Desulfofervidaceae bacterium]|nr:response regulator [Candidatus Desulfofervidaceae bacterium]
MKRKYRVLILDDEPIVCKRLKPSLEKMGYEVEAFTDSEAALKRIEEKEFDIVVTDLKMEKVDGIQILEAAKQKNPKTEVIIITGFATTEAAKSALKKGAFDFIAKPFRLEDLRLIIAKAAEKLEQQDQNA